MITFDNTEIAFESKSDKDLKRAYQLFKIIGNNTLVKIGKPMTTFSLKIGLPIKGLIRSTIFAQFCGGENINDCDKTINHLGKFGVQTILDYSVEGKTTDADLDRTTEEIIATIKKATKSNYIPFGVFKPTGLARFELLEKANVGLDQLSEKERIEYDQFIARATKICQAGFDNNIPIFIDAEHSWIQDTIDRMVYDLMLLFNKEKAIVYNTIQMYRHDRLAFMQNEIERAKKDGIKYGVKVVRGAYMEIERERAAEFGYKDPIQPNKEASDRDFDAVIELLVNELNQVAFCCGSHNEESAQKLADLIAKHNIDKKDTRIFFAQLLGMSDHISYNLSKLGYNVAKYVPYGPISEVMPYLLRRADENTSIAGQTGRELSLIIKELNRRKKK